MVAPSHVRSRRARLLCAGWLALLAACGAADAASTPAETETEAEAIEVGVVAIHAREVALQTELIGRTAPYQSAEVRPQVSGIIKAREFVEGSQVEAGQVLYTIDRASYRATYKRARAELERAEANLLAAEVRARRHAELVKTHAVSAQEHDDARAAHAQAQAEVAERRAALKSTKIDLQRTRLVAPIAGRIGRSRVTQGALITEGQSEPLALIQQLDPIYVDVTQSSAELLRLKRLLAEGGAKPASTRVSLTLEDGSTYGPRGELQFSEVNVDQSTGSVTLRALFPNPQGVLLPGMVVRAVIEEAVQPRAFLAPQRGVTRDEKGQAIALVVDASDRVAVRALVTERAIGDHWLVLEGLAEGERLIVEGLDKVSPGMRVKPVVVDLRTPMAATDQAPKGS